MKLPGVPEAAGACDDHKQGQQRIRRDGFQRAFGAVDVGERLPYNRVTKKVFF